MTSATVSMHSLLKLISISVHVILGSFEGLLHALPHKIFLLKLAVIFISVLMISIPPRPSLKTYRQQSNDRTFWFLACFFIHMILFILKMFNPAISPLHWFIPTGTIKTCMSVASIFILTL